MTLLHRYLASDLSAAEVAQTPGLLLLDFGTNGCGHCQAAQMPIADALAAYPQVRHVSVEDGKGRPLGRAFKVTLWPTLVFLREGLEVARVVRPTAAADVSAALQQIVK